jgi:hypothetical protein
MPKPTGDHANGISRRRFLYELGAAGGAAAVLSSMEVLGLATPASATRRSYRAPSRSDFTLQGRTNGTRILVLGAGVAGLCTAYELEKAGYEVELHERRSAQRRGQPQLLPAAESGDGVSASVIHPVDWRLSLEYRYQNGRSGRRRPLVGGRCLTPAASARRSLAR